MSYGNAGCPTVVVVGVLGQPGSCVKPPTHTAVVWWGVRRGWVRIFPCEQHAAEQHAAEPMTDRHRAMLAERREQIRLALAGQPYAKTPTSPDRDGV